MGSCPEGGNRMRLDLRDVILVPDAEKSFQCQVDLSDLEFYGRKPIVRKKKRVKNRFSPIRAMQLPVL